MATYQVTELVSSSFPPSPSPHFLFFWKQIWFFNKSTSNNAQFFKHEQLLPARAAEKTVAVISVSCPVQLNMVLTEAAFAARDWALPP